MSLREAINKKCRDCAYDPLDAGSAAQQIACCVSKDCPLHPVRPVTAKAIPSSLLDAYHINPVQLDERARGLVTSDQTASGDDKFDLLLTLESISEPQLT